MHMKSRILVALCLAAAIAGCNVLPDLLPEGKKINYANVLAVLTRLKQICDHPKLGDLTGGRVRNIKNIDLEESGKWEAVQELLQRADGPQSWSTAKPD